MANSTKLLKGKTRIFGRDDRIRRMLRILFACRPNALHSVPDCALFAKNSPPDCFLRYRPSQVRILSIENNKEKST